MDKKECHRAMNIGEPVVGPLTNGRHPVGRLVAENGDEFNLKLIGQDKVLGPYPFWEFSPCKNTKLLLS